MLRFLPILLAALLVTSGCATPARVTHPPATPASVTEQQPLLAAARAGDLDGLRTALRANSDVNVADAKA